MPRKEKEKDRVEKIIRGLLKESGNRRCINCNSLGPQYVCTTFWTFICTSCSGVHREFSHRVKSVSMAKFNAEEISCLQTGGNERAREIYFKTWDAQQNTHPDPSNLYKLREFIKQMYVDRKYAGQNVYEKPTMARSVQRSGSIELRSVQTLSFGVKDEIRERHSYERYSSSMRDENGSDSSDRLGPKTNDGRGFSNILEERRSPQHVQENKRSSSQKNRPTRFEIVDDRFREDGRTKVFDRYSSSKESRPGSRSPGSQSSGKAKVLAIMPPGTDTSGNTGPVVKVVEPPRVHAGKDGKSSEQKAANTKSASITEKQNQDKTVNFTSLIDFDANPEPSCNTANTLEPLQPGNTDTQSSSASSSAPEKEDNARNITSLESLLFEWSVPTTSSPAVGASQSSDAAQALTSALPNNAEAPDYGSQMFAVTTGDVNLSATISDNDEVVHRNSSDSMAPVTEVNQLNMSPASNDASQFPSVRLDDSSQAGNAGDAPKTNGRKELPADLFFAPSFTGYNPVAPGFQMHPSHAMGSGMHFHPPVMSTNGFQNRAKPSNPFDFGDDGLQVEAAILPTVSPLQGALPNLQAATPLQPQPSPYGASVFPQVSQYGMNMQPVPGAYMGSHTQPNNMLLPRPQGNAGLGSGQDPLGYLNPIQQQGIGTDSSSPAPNSSFSRGSNPFA